MAWNDNQNHNNPNNEPPDLDEVINKFKEKFTKFGGNNDGKNNNSGGDGVVQINPGLIKFSLIIIVLIWLAFGFYIVDTGEKGVELRFGEYKTTTNAGPHWHLPAPIDEHIIVKVDEVKSAKIGFRNIRQNQQQFVGNVSSESLMLTKDENIIDAKFEVQFKIKDVKNYLFNVVNPEETLRQITQSVIRLVVGKNTMDYVITEGRADIISNIEEGAQILLDDYQTGLVITAINMVDAQAPEQVQAAFSDVVKSREDKERLVNEAETYANGIVPQARGEAARMLEEARAYQSQVISKADGEASRFSQVRVEYEKATEVTRHRLYLETMEGVLSKTSKVVVDNQSNNIMYLPLDKLGTARNIAGEANNKKNTPNNNTPARTNVRNAFRTREIR